jgi:hypoxanthine phosphoribosyltransferase
MENIKIRDREFKLFITGEKINSVIQEMAAKISSDLKDKDPLFVCVLNGAFMFASELIKSLDFVESEITFVKMASYRGTHSTGFIRQLIGLNEVIEGRTVVILEDIVDSGSTIENIIHQLKEMNPGEIRIATLLFKPAAVLKEIQLDYVGIEIPNDFIVGFGLDYDGYGRNLKDIYSVIN